MCYLIVSFRSVFFSILHIHMCTLPATPCICDLTHLAAQSSVEPACSRCSNDGQYGPSTTAGPFRCIFPAAIHMKPVSCRVSPVDLLLFILVPTLLSLSLSIILPPVSHLSSHSPTVLSPSRLPVILVVFTLCLPASASRRRTSLMWSFPLERPGLDPDYLLTGE